MSQRQRKVLGGIGRAVVGFATGGAAGALTSAFASRPGGGPRPPSGGFSGVSIQNPIRMMQQLGAIPAGRGRVAAVNGQCPRGFHLNKAPLADRTPARAICVRNRSVNALNGRAATRALKRIKRAEKLVRKLRLFSGVRRQIASSSGGHRAGCGCAICKRK